MSSLLQDLRYGLRSLRSHLGFTLVAVLILGFGIGAATALFTVVDGVLLRPLPYPDPGRIVWVQEVSADGHGMRMADSNFRDLRERSRSLQALAELSNGLSVSVTGVSGPVRTVATMVSADFFRVMGVAPARGRGFVPAEERRGGDPAVIVSHAFWRRWMGGGPIAGRTLKYGGSVFNIVGVMPPGFDYPRGTDLWVPAALLPHATSRTAHNWHVVGRLADGVTLAQARGELSAIARRLKAVYGNGVDLVDFSAMPLRHFLVGGVRTPLLSLLGAAVLLFLIALANVGNLMVARFAARRRELAVRRALGAGKGRLLQQVLTETAVLGLAAAGVGVLLAELGVKALLALAPSYLPRVAGVRIDARVLLFAAAIAIATALALGVGAALGGRRDLRSALAGGGRTLAGTDGGRLARDTLIVGQVTLTLVLLIGAALMARSVMNLLIVDPGFRTDHVLVMDVAAPWAGNHAANDARLHSFEHRLLTRLRALPGVAAVGSVDAFPLEDCCADGTYLVLDRPDEVKSLKEFESLVRQPGRTGTARWQVASAGYFETMGIPLLRGRWFSDRDTPDATVDAALVSHSFVQRQWPGQDPLGKLIQFGNMDGDLRPFRVVGVVGDVRSVSLSKRPEPAFYADYRQRTGLSGVFHVAIHTEGDPRALISAARWTLREVAPEVPPAFRTVREILSFWTADRRFALSLLGVFGAVALALATAGVWALVAYLAVLRSREIGVRVALGARSTDVVRLVVGRTAVLALSGIGLGILAAIALTGLLSSLLYGVRSTDPFAFAAGSLILLAAAFAASLVPAWRAARIDPLEVLREE